MLYILVFGHERQYYESHLMKTCWGYFLPGALFYVDVRDFSGNPVGADVVVQECDVEGNRESERINRSSYEAITSSFTSPVWELIWRRINATTLRRDLLYHDSDPLVLMIGCTGGNHRAPTAALRVRDIADANRVSTNIFFLTHLQNFGDIEAAFRLLRSKGDVCFPLLENVTSADCIPDSDLHFGVIKKFEPSARTQYGFIACLGHDVYFRFCDFQRFDSLTQQQKERAEAELVGTAVVFKLDTDKGKCVLSGSLRVFCDGLTGGNQLDICEP